MVMSDRRHSPLTLSPEKRLLLSIGQEGG